MLRILRKLTILPCSTFIITFINANDLSNFVTRRTRNALKIRSDRNAFKLTMLVKTCIIILPKSIKEKETIVPSKIFMLSLTYPEGLKAKFFKIISPMNMKVKTKLQLKVNYK